MAFTTLVLADFELVEDFDLVFSFESAADLGLLPVVDLETAVEDFEVEDIFDMLGFDPETVEAADLGLPLDFDASELLLALEPVVEEAADLDFFDLPVLLFVELADFLFFELASPGDSSSIGSTELGSSRILPGFSPASLLAAELDALPDTTALASPLVFDSSSTLLMPCSFMYCTILRVA